MLTTGSGVSEIVTLSLAAGARRPAPGAQCCVGAATLPRTS